MGNRFKLPNHRFAVLETCRSFRMNIHNYSGVAHFGTFEDYSDEANGYVEMMISEAKRPIDMLKYANGVVLHDDKSGEHIVIKNKYGPQTTFDNKVLAESLN